jgi:hypothetical protein
MSPIRDFCTIPFNLNHCNFDTRNTGPNIDQQMGRFAYKNETNIRVPHRHCSISNDKKIVVAGIKNRHAIYPVHDNVLRSARGMGQNKRPALFN